MCHFVVIVGMTVKMAPGVYMSLFREEKIVESSCVHRGSSVRLGLVLKDWRHWRGNHFSLCNDGELSARVTVFLHCSSMKIYNDELLAEPDAFVVFLLSHLCKKCLRH